MDVANAVRLKYSIYLTGSLYCLHKYCVGLQCFWAMGACAEVILALWVMPTLGWSGLLALSTIPLILFVIVCQVSFVYYI